MLTKTNIFSGQNFKGNAVSQQFGNEKQNADVAPQKISADAHE